MLGFSSITVIVSPYHVGIRDHRVGAGASRIVEEGLQGRLNDLGYTVNVHSIASVDDFEGEIGRSFEVIRRIAFAVDHAITSESFPIVLAGNCNASVGVAAGLKTIEDFDIVWFDAHADLDSPDEALSGYFDGMGVSMLSGESWKALMRTVPGHRPLPLDKFTFCGVRAVSDEERRKLAASSAQVVWGEIDGRVEFADRLDDLLVKQPNQHCLVHVDLDCLDVSVGKANDFAASGGLLANELLNCLDIVSVKRRPVALTVASFDPKLEGGDRIAEIAVDAIVRLMMLMQYKG